MSRPTMRTLSLSALLLTSCVSWHHKPAMPRPDASREIVNRSFESTWSNLVAWFATSNVTIDKLEKPSGLITAKHTLAVGQEDIDIGEIDASGSFGGISVTRFAEINVLAKPLTPGTTAVAVNVFGRFRAQTRDLWDGRIQNFEGPAESTGRIEQQILSVLR